MPSANICVPGQKLCSNTDNTVAGTGTYVFGDFVYASLAGVVLHKCTEDGKDHVLVEGRSGQGVMPSVGCIVRAKVTRVTQRYCKALITAVDGVQLHEPFRAILRREDVRAKEKDKVQMHKSYRPGDWILAKVLTLGDASSYWLTTAENELGVVVAVSEAGATMVPISWCEMQCPITYLKESRKVAKVQKEHCRVQR